MDVDVKLLPHPSFKSMIGYERLTMQKYLWIRKKEFGILNFFKATTSTTYSPLTTLPNLFSSIICYDDRYGVKSISCSNGVIKLKNANFGRTDKTTCCYGTTVSLVGADRVCSNTNCYSNRTDLFKSTCDLQKKLYIHNQLY